MPSIRTALTYVSGLLSSLLIAGGVLICQHSGAAATTDAHKPPAVPPAQPKKIANGPSWQALTTAQQLALVPLAGEWDSMDSSRKEKWIAIGNRYARMSPAEQTRIQTRMRDWVKLTPEQRRSVRQSYVRSKKLDANQKATQWQQYQQLSDEQKAQLAKQKLSPMPATAISRARTKPKVLLPIPHKPASANATAPATAPIAPTGTIMPPAVLPAPSLAVPPATVAPQPHK
jgi:hypothetical protein